MVEKAIDAAGYSSDFAPLAIREKSPTKATAAANGADGRDRAQILRRLEGISGSKVWRDRYAKVAMFCPPRGRKLSTSRRADSTCRVLSLLVLEGGDNVHLFVDATSTAELYEIVGKSSWPPDLPMTNIGLEEVLLMSPSTFAIPVLPVAIGATPSAGPTRATDSDPVGSRPAHVG